MLSVAAPKTTDQETLVVGMGEIGSVFALGLLRRGYTVVPILRSTPVETILARPSNPSLCVVAVAEDDLDHVLDGWARRYADRWVLMQNELRPSEWERRGLDTPTVAVVWFEKKPGREPHTIVSTPVHGPHAQVVISALSSLGLPVHHEPDREQLLFELCLKNLYILSMNFAGLEYPTDVGTIWHEHRPYLDQICIEVLELEAAQMQRNLPTQSLCIELERVIMADPRHVAAGRNALARLHRSRRTAKRLGIVTPTLDAIAAKLEAR
jgi:ketopantoate reductase